MKFNQPIVFLLFGAAFSAFFACNDPTVIGEDLLIDDQLGIGFTDTLTLRTYNLEEDSVLTFDPNVFVANFSSFPVGNFMDPVFGTSKSSIAAQVTLTGSAPDFSGQTCDSIVLILPYEPDQTYGMLNQPYTFEVFEMTQILSDSVEYYSDQSFEFDPVPIGTKEFFPAPQDSVRVYDAREDDFNVQFPQLRINLTEEFKNDFFGADPLNFETVDAFLDFFRGFYIQSVSNQTNGGLVSFRFNSLNAGIRVYYHLDTVFSEYFFQVSSANVLTARFEHSYQGSFVEEFLGEDAPLKDSLLFLQGMSGINFVIEIPYADELDNIIVNQAEIELPIVFLPIDDPTYTPIEQIIISEILEDGSRRLIEDVARTNVNTLSDIFGGVPDGEVYRLNISAHFQDMIQSSVTKKMLVTANVKPEVAARAVLAGPQNGDRPAKLNLTFTQF